MFRLLIIVATVMLAIPCSHAHAQRRGLLGLRSSGPGFALRAGSGRESSRKYTSDRDRYDRAFSGDRPPYRAAYGYPSSSFGISIGIGGYPGPGNDYSRYGYSRYGSPGFGYSGFGYGFGYPDPYRFDGFGYDPYRYGSFEPPDLLNDPYFQERYRYSSKFPGRYRTPLVVRPSHPTVSYDALQTANVGTYPDRVARVPAGSHPIAATSPAAVKLLSRSLSARRDGELWREYLALDQITVWMESENIEKLVELLDRYEVVVADREFDPIAKLQGFEATRSMLRQSIGDAIDSSESIVNAPEIKSPVVENPLFRSQDFEKPSIQSSADDTSSDDTLPDDPWIESLPAPAAEAEPESVEYFDL